MTADRAERCRDRSGSLTPAERERIESYLEFVDREHGIDARVLVEAGLARGADLAETTLAEYERLGIGGGTGGRGLLLLVLPSRATARVEVGYALEPWITDLDASRLVNDYLGPHFSGDELGPALEAAVEGVVDRLLAGRDALAEADLVAHGSGGAGAAGEHLDRPAADGPEVDAGALAELLVPQPDPRATRDLEIAMMHRGVYLGSAAIYDADWRASRRPGRWSARRLREIARQWDRPYEILVDGPYAIAFYGDAPALGPTLLRREADGWIIDATTGARAIVYDYSNEGWYAIDGDYPYLDLLERVFDLRPVKLTSGQRAWMPVFASPDTASSRGRMR